MSVFTSPAFPMNGQMIGSCQYLDKPFISLREPHMPKPGPSFLQAARLYLGERLTNLETEMQVTPRRHDKLALKAQVQSLLGEAVDDFYHRALYDRNFTLAVETRGRTDDLLFLPGHVWGDMHQVGPVKGPKVMIVGKHPGFEEVSTRRYLVGPTSEFLKEALSAAGFKDFLDWYVTAVVRFFPRNPGGGSVTLASSWLNDCAPLLAQELALIEPEYIICLGADAIRAVLGKGQTQAGTAKRVIDITLPGGAQSKVVTSLHSAALAYAPEKEDEFREGLLFIKEAISGSGEPLLDPERDCEHTVLHSFKELKTLVAQLKRDGCRDVAIDLEWDGVPGESDHYIRTIQFSWGWKKAALIPLHSEFGVRYFSGTDRQVKALLKEWLKPQHMRLIGHYLVEDIKVLLAWGDMEWLHEKLLVPEHELDEEGRILVPGFDKTRTSGPWDTGAGAHAYNEMQLFGLEDLGRRFTTCGPYSKELEDYKVKYCKEQKISKGDLTGYGFVPDEILWRYALYDADVTWRLFHLQNRYGGQLDRDRYGNDNRESFWIAMRAMPAFLQASLCGLKVDWDRAEQIRQDYNQRRDELLAELRQRLNWPDFNPNSTPQCREAFFGEEYNRKYDAEGRPMCCRPEGAISLRLMPYKSTGKRAQLWAKLVQNGTEDQFDPALDKEALTELAAQSEEAALLRDIRYIGQVTRSALHDPKQNRHGEEVFDEEGNPIFEKGILHWVRSDGRIHTHFSQNKETSRASSWQPAMQNWGKRREKDYARILGERYRWPLRSIFQADEGRILIEADYIAAEVCVAAWMSGDPNLLEHARRSCLPEDHPDYFDIHSNIAVRTFKLDCLPTKEALKNAGLAHFRDAAKIRFFGWFYGQGVTAAWRQIRMEGVSVSLDDVRELTTELEETYPGVVRFFQEAYACVSNPGYVVGAYGNRRRMIPSSDEEVLKSQERQFANFLIQGGVAKAVELAMGNVLEEQRARPDLDFLICLQLHDALYFDCKIEDAPTVYREVIPLCMSKLVPFVPCHMDGTPRQGEGPYYFGVDRTLSLRWGEKLPEDFAKKHGLTKESLA